MCMIGGMYDTGRASMYAESELIQLDKAAFYTKPLIRTQCWCVNHYSSQTFRYLSYSTPSDKCRSVEKHEQKRLEQCVKSAVLRQDPEKCQEFSSSAHKAP